MQIEFNKSTEEFAGIQKIKPESVRARVSRTGSYFGVKPIRCPNGRLRWPDAQVTHSDTAEAAAADRSRKAVEARQEKRAVKS
jgi:hypothetical protein